MQQLCIPKIYCILTATFVVFAQLSCRSGHPHEKPEIIKSGYPLDVSFTLSKPALKDIPAIEKRHNGVRYYARYTVGMSSDYFPGAGNYQYGQPLLYERDTATVRTSVSYFYSIPDSTLRLIEYSWDANHRNDKEIIRLFVLSKKLIPDALQLPGVATTEKKPDWSREWTIWQTDSVYVRQFMLVEGTPPAPSRTRVLVSWH